MSAEQGFVLDKDAVRAILKRLVSGKGFSPGDLGIEQATNRIGALQRPPRNVYEAALTVHCPYCGMTAGNPCRVHSRDVSKPTPHLSRIQAAFDSGEKK